MGYQTTFTGKFKLDQTLSDEHREYLALFSQTRRMQRDASIANRFPDPVRLAVGLPIGEEGEYFVGATGFAGQDRDESILDYNQEPKSQPGLWCKWEPDKKGKSIQWNGAEKFYHYQQWLEYLIQHFLAPWSYELNGAVKWKGEDPSDRGVLLVKNNVVSFLAGLDYKAYIEEQKLAKLAKQQQNQLQVQTPAVRGQTTRRL